MHGVHTRKPNLHAHKVKINKSFLKNRQTPRSPVCVVHACNLALERVRQEAEGRPVRTAALPTSHHLSNRTHNLRNLEISPDLPTAGSGTQGLIHLKDRCPTRPSGKMSLASIFRVPRAAAVGLA